MFVRIVAGEKELSTEAGSEAAVEQIINSKSKKRVISLEP